MLVGLGQAYELTMRPIGGGYNKVVQFPKAYWWAWRGTRERGSIELVKLLPGGKSGSVVQGSALSIHREFHDAEPSAALRVDAPSLRLPFKMIGLAIAFAYDARGFSSSKKSAPYCHHFGSMSEDDHPPFSESFWPAVMMDRDDGISLRRLPGNAFYLSEWVTG